MYTNLIRAVNSGGFKVLGPSKEGDKILKFFPDFDVFALTAPSFDVTVTQSLNQKESQGKILPLFKKQLKEFQQMLHSKLTPKRSFVGQGFVTGEALATLVEEYLQAGSLFGAIPVVESSQTEFKQRGQDSGSDLKGSRASNKGATPLCLPNNLKWDSTSGQYIQTEERRTSLYVLDEALEKLRRIQGPVCVISIAGLYRSGKSFVLSEAFSQPQVFRIGHRMTQETRGIWLWIVKEKFKDAKGQEFTVALLDSEGINGEMDLDDNQICPLTLLLASVFIYNSKNAPRRWDLHELEYPLKYF